MMQKSDLDPSGFTYTHEKGYEWAKDQVLAIRSALGSSTKNAQGHMWTYRLYGHEMLALYVTIDERPVYEGTITSNNGKYELELSGDEAFVPDMSEAIHLAGIIFQSLDIPVKIGRLVNETNRNLCEPFRVGQTNAHIQLIKDL